MTMRHFGGLLGAIVSLIAIWEFAAPRFFSTEPQIVQFRLDPSSILPGERANLVWEVANADRVMIQPDLGVVPTVGTRQIQVLASRTFTLTATKGKSVAAKPLVITPAEPPTPTVHLSADPPSQFKGETVTLTWNVTEADSVVIGGIGAVPPSGSREEIVAESRTYELKATNRFNKSAAKQLTVAAKDWPVPTLAVSAEPNPVIKGRSTTVRWQSAFAKSVVIEPFGIVESSGSRPLDIEQSLTIRARAEGPGGIQTADLTVEAQQLVSVLIPKGQNIWIRLLQPLGSGVSQSEDAFEATLQRDLRIGALKVASEGAAVWGRVGRVETPGRVQGRAIIELVLERLTLLDGSVAHVDTDVIRRNKSSLGKDIVRTLVGAGAGAAAGAALDGTSGAAKGLAAGGGAGTAISMAERGEDVLIPAGAQLKFTVAKPTSVEMLRVP